MSYLCYGSKDGQTEAMICLLIVKLKLTNAETFMSVSSCCIL